MNHQDRRSTEKDTASFDHSAGSSSSSDSREKRRPTPDVEHEGKEPTSPALVSLPDFPEGGTQAWLAVLGGQVILLLGARVHF